MSARDDDALLLGVATPGLYRKNAFRLTALPVTATARQIAKQADKLKMLAELGGQAAQQFSVLPDAAPPSAEEVREALQRLKDVEARAIDEFFWFWPEHWDRPEEDEAFGALNRFDPEEASLIWLQRWKERREPAAGHNVAVVYHLRALEWAAVDLVEPQEPSTKEHEHNLWDYSANMWHEVAAREDLWDHFKERIRQVEDAALTSGFARRLRSSLEPMLCRISAELTLAYVSQDRPAEARWHATFLRQFSQGRSAAVWREPVLAPTRQQIKRALEAAQKETSENALSGMERAASLLEIAQPSLQIFEFLYQAEDLERVQVFDQVAGVAVTLAIAGYNATTEKLKNSPLTRVPSAGSQAYDPKVEAGEQLVRALQAARTLAHDYKLLAKIDQNLAIARSNICHSTTIEPLAARLQAIQGDKKKSARVRLGLIRASILPRVAELMRSPDFTDADRATLSQAVASSLRALGIEAHNELHDWNSAVEAMDLALRYAVDGTMRELLLRDKKTLSVNRPEGAWFVPSSDSGPKPDRQLWVGGLVVALGIAAVFVMVVASLPKTAPVSPPTFRPPSTTYTPPLIYNPTVAFDPPTAVNPPTFSVTP